MKFPDEMLAKANRESPEEAWKISDFPKVLEKATMHGLACIGGQFQFRGPLGIAEMYWLNADSDPKQSTETWNQYVERANSEVLNKFNKIIQSTDFNKEARSWKHIAEAMDSGKIPNPTEYLYFVAYFNYESM